jgi:tape measure domain-containing protein
MAEKIIEEIILKVSADTKGVDLGLSKVQKKIAPTERGLKNLRKSVKEMKNETKKATKETGLLSDAMGKLASGAAAGLVIAKLKNLGEEAIQVSRKFERIKLSMETAFGGDAPQQMAFIEGEAQKLGLVTSEVASGYAKLANSTKLAGVSLEDTQGIFVATAEAATALGLSSEDVNGVLRAFSQMAAKGKVSAEELNQIAERGIPVQAMMAGALGKSKEEIESMAQKGELLSKDVLPQLASAIRNTFHEGAMSNANSELSEHNRNLSRWETHLKNTGNELKTVTTPATSLFLDFLDGGADIISDGILLLLNHKATLALLGEGMTKATSTSKEFEDATKDVGVAVSNTTKLIDSFKERLKFEVRFEDVRLSLGLTEKGFSKIRKEVEALSKETDSTYELVSMTEDLVKALKEADAFKDEDFIIADKEVKRSEEIRKNMMEWIGDEFVMPKGFETFGKVLTGEAPKPQDLSGARTPQEGLELGTAEAAKFLIRPVKEENKIQKQQLAEDKKIAANTKKIAENPIIMERVGF